jgi:putative ABC transport system ATP-binding protein
MIEFHDVSFRYQGSASSAPSVAGFSGFALHIQTLAVGRGERIALVGPSGSGKTTLLSLVAGILRPESGTVRVDGQELSRLGDAAVRQFRIERVGQVFQSFELLDYLSIIVSIIENVMLPWYIGRGSQKVGSQKADSRRRALELLDEVGLASRANARPGQLSQGEQQRVAVCRAMLNHPPLLLADEPTGNLDQDNKQMVVDLLLQQARHQDSTLLMVTHDQSLLGRFDTVLDIRTVSGEGVPV